MLELRRTVPNGLWASLAQATRRAFLPRPGFLRARLDEAPAGSALGFLRDAGRIAKATAGRAIGSKAAGFFRQLFRFQAGLETAFLASGAATQLADAALEGEPTPALATRIAQIARSLSGAIGAEVHLRSAAGLSLLGADGDACDGPLAEEAFGRGEVTFRAHAAAVPLRVRQSVVGTLSLKFAGPPHDLRPLQPLLARAGAVIAAAEREARKDRFLSLAAHELKTPLTTIKGFSYSLARKLEKGQPCDARSVEVLERQAEKLHALLEELLEVSRLETGRFVLHQEPCQLAELVDASRRSLRRLGADDGVEAVVDPDLPMVADRERVERALTAMVLRAQMLGGGAARIAGVRRGGHAELRVAWDGEPIEARELGRAFDPRWEAPQAQRQGLGMALLVAVHTAEQHGGTLRAEERAFVLELPTRTPTQEPRTAVDAGTVLVVDDDEHIARMMAEFFCEHGFAADWAGGGLAALEKIKADPPDLIVLDLRMPDLDGRSLLLAVRGMGLVPRVVLLSSDRDVASAARELGCEGFVEKPFAPEGLLAAVRRALPQQAK